MPEDKQQLNTSLISNSRPYLILARGEVNAVRNGIIGVIAPSSEVWGKCLYLMYRPSGDSGEGVSGTSRSGSVRANHM